MKHINLSFAKIKNLQYNSVIFTDFFIYNNNN